MMPAMESSPPSSGLLALLPEELAQVLGGSGRAKQVWALLRSGENPVDHASLGKKIRTALERDLSFVPPKLLKRQEARCGTRKLMLEMEDGARVESVIIPGERRDTLCLSTQVGCARGCAFCATGAMGLTRNLRAEEMTGQVWLAMAERPISNLVFMGMGEPLDNFEAVARAIRILGHPMAFAVAPRRMTLSTIGPSPEAVARCSDLSVNLAWSLHAADDELRARLVPRPRYANAEIRDAFARILRGQKTKLFVEMALVDGLNDGLAQADALMDFFAAMNDRVRINLLPVNPGPGDFAPSPAARVQRFKKHLQDHGFFCEARKARGEDIRAACGQLAAE